MATHYVYIDPDKSQLAQGDILQRTDSLVKLLNHYHPHYAEHPDYQFFAILTQSCDLVRRAGKTAKSPYITIAAARTIEDTLLREAAKRQKDWQRPTKLIGQSDRNNLLMFLQRLLDNNEPGYFYLHIDQSLGINRACCVVLPLAVSVRVQHYDMLLEAKIAQITDAFQAKLGWLIGNLYGRVGTTEWDKEYPDNPIKDAARKILDATLVSVTDEQIKEFGAELKQDSNLTNKSAIDLVDYIRRKKILPRSRKFAIRAAEVSRSLRLVNPIQGRTALALQEGDSLKQSIKQLLFTADVPVGDVDDLADKLIGTVSRRLGEVMTDANLPGRDEIALGFIRGLLQDPQIAALLS